MHHSGEQPVDLSARIAAAKERGRQRAIARDLVNAGLIPDSDAVQFVGDAEVTSIMRRAHESGLQTGWRQRAGWDEIGPELRLWLGGQDRVVSALTRVVAAGSWFAERLVRLQQLWGDLYLYAPDGLSGYLVNHDSERGLETISWRSLD